MKILIVSDTHKKNENYFKVLEMHHPDMVIHCGDAEGSEYALSSAAECPVYIVLGTMTFSRISPERSHWISDPTKYG